MYQKNVLCYLLILFTLSLLFSACATIPAPVQEKDWNAYTDEVTGVKVHRIVASPHTDEVVYYTHPMWTQNMEHLLFNPAWLEGVAALFPVRHYLVATIDSFLGVGDGWDVTAVVVLSLWGVGGLLVASRWFSWEPRR